MEKLRVICFNFVEDLGVPRMIVAYWGQSTTHCFNYGHMTRLFLLAGADVDFTEWVQTLSYGGLD